jgi:hypothetical protein
VAAHSLVAAVETNPIDIKNCSVKIYSADAKLVRVHYVTMPDNTPQENHDKFYVWTGGPPRIPYAGKPLKTFDFSIDDYEGTVGLTPLSLGNDKSYCIGLAVGPDPKNTVAATFLKFPADDGPPIIGPSTSAFLTFVSASSDAVQVALTTPTGYKAKTWASVVRLFEGEVAPLSQSSNLGEKTLGSDNAQNPVLFDSLQLAAKYNYTVGFYTNAADDQWTTLAASLTFMI